MLQEINPSELELSTVQEFAKLTKKAVSTVYTDLSEDRCPHPPIYRATPNARPLFVNARAWLAEQVQRSLQVDPAQPIPSVTTLKKRGRPSNLSRKLAGMKGGV